MQLLLRAVALRHGSGHDEKCVYVIAFFVTAGPVTVCGDVKFEVPPLRDFNIYVMRLKERLSHRFTSRRLRYLALTSHEQVQLRDIKKTLIFIAYLKNEAVEEGDHDTVANLQDLHDIFAAKYILIKYSPLDDIALEYLPDYRRTIDSFDDSRCDLQFQFKKDHLHLLLKLLRFPDVISFDNRAKMFGEERYFFAAFMNSVVEILNMIAPPIFSVETSLLNPVHTDGSLNIFTTTFVIL